MNNLPKLKLLSGITNDLIHLEQWRNPFEIGIIINNISFQINLLTGKFSPEDRKDTFGEIYSWKSKWFIQKTKKLGILGMIKSANIKIKFGIEKVKIETADGRIFEKEKNWNDFSY